MSKHTQRTLPFDTRTDPDTGAKVTRLTPRAITCHRNYFYQKCFTNDGKRVIFGGEFGPDVGHPAKPNWNYHLLDLEGLKEWRVGRIELYAPLERAVDESAFYDGEGNVVAVDYRP